MPPVPDARPTLRLALDAAEKVLAEGAHPERARRDTETLLLHVLKTNVPDVNLAWLIAHDGETLAADAAASFCDLIERRLAGEPIQYITGEAEFYDLPFYVNRDVLIPRPETEHLVEKTIALAAEFVRPKIVDVGTGSAAIAVALAHALPLAEITATDISAGALAVAKANAARNGVADRVRFLEGDLLEPVAGEHFDIVVSNPPYVPESDRATLDVEVRDYEPSQALFAGEDGLAIYRRLIPAAFGALVPGGFVTLEIGYGQRAGIEALLAREGFAGIEFIADLQGIARVAVAQRTSS
ncbi:MAG: peptide chain release factor N(5)-glutamine methyltransferase [Terracidiphilus sp.]|nr:peptide chain release factor N(5)-glutamine methyltransferase [Terracidiphilus sp.]MDR3798697.1 peptide chain release factor N(5)-glutamine methyltransferase [Terracidiphilus sp.]